MMHPPPSTRPFIRRSGFGVLALASQALSTPKTPVAPTDLTQTRQSDIAIRMSPTFTDFPVTLALLNGLEVVTLLAVILILFGYRYFGDLRRGLGQGFRFRNQIDRMGEEAGRSVGYNYAKPIRGAITHNNEIVEFLDRRELGRVNFRLWKRAKRWAAKAWQRLVGRNCS
jgi:hypothetical protein